MIELPASFPHIAPSGYAYEVENFNTRVLRIMLRHHKKYDYNLGKSVATVWGFYSPKKRIYYSPINAASVGREVSINETSPYTAMPILMNPLEKQLYSV